MRLCVVCCTQPTKAHPRKGQSSHQWTMFHLGVSDKPAILQYSGSSPVFPVIAGRDTRAQKSGNGGAEIKRQKSIRRNDGSKGGCTVRRSGFQPQ